MIARERERERLGKKERKNTPQPNPPHPTPPHPTTHQQLPIQKLRKECGGNTESSPETVPDTSQPQEGGKTMLARHRFPSLVSFLRCYRYFWPTLACQSRQMEREKKKTSSTSPGHPHTDGSLSMLYDGHLVQHVRHRKWPTSEKGGKSLGL